MTFEVIIQSHWCVSVDCSKEAGETKTPEGEAPAEEEEDLGPEEMTLDEYKAQLTKQRTQQEFKLRRAGEGVDDAQWKKMYVLKKKVEEEEDEDDDEEYEASTAAGV